MNYTLPSIKELISDEISKDSSYVIGTNIDENKRVGFDTLYSEFYTSKTYGEANSNSKLLLQFFLNFHEKNTVVGPCFEVLNRTESYKDIFEKQRLHTIHTLNVFFLGLLLYHKNPLIRKYIDLEIEKTTSERELRLNGNRITWRYSGGSIFSEFLYRWRLCALPHDVGYPISLAENDNDKIESILKSISIVQSKNINSMNSLINDSEENLLDVFDSSLSFIKLKDYFTYQISHPLFEKVYYDHGIISALLIFNLLRKEYANHSSTPVTFNGSTKIVWNKSFINNSILHSARAIACHNLDQDAIAYKRFKTVDNIYNIEESPLIWLLKVSDILQEWDKPNSQTDFEKKEIEATNIKVEFNNDSVTFWNMSNKDKLISKIKEMNSESLINIK